ncbi:hypothetical protein B0I72DRAFT_165818 [Yarrowia lipolytica]|uniref:Uncharacterized protein n=1 Tax=Yarrowia lipolytica TaxID=4952 RepID=A0A371C475_YARLL|nr:hypothetical protein B0I71DRAFT_159664 [Yarrowia lipolytica]RDW35665.1 hypothetical protein B0I72DRAFT_165818 [Yarrowia lipolytica]RDW45954.1 hypothetical protein B0I74DRAFT_112432 [Yarrowia lipolytica]RDW52511.1 hypothetical protein B0I75DRAFT_118680 [Yarrowia lipolytica]
MYSYSVHTRRVYKAIPPIMMSPTYHPQQAVTFNPIFPVRRSVSNVNEGRTNTQSGHTNKRHTRQSLTDRSTITNSYTNEPGSDSSLLGIIANSSVITTTTTTTTRTRTRAKSPQVFSQIRSDNSAAMSVSSHTSQQSILTTGSRPLYGNKTEHDYVWDKLDESATINSNRVWNQASADPDVGESVMKNRQRLLSKAGMAPPSQTQKKTFQMPYNAVYNDTLPQQPRREDSMSTSADVIQSHKVPRLLRPFRSIKKAFTG